MMDRGVVYVAIGRPTAPILEASLWTLRRHWQGAVAILTDRRDERAILAKAADARLMDVQPDSSSADQGHYIKASVPKLSPFSSTIQLDWDTLISGDIKPLFPDEDDDRIVLTHHAEKFLTHLQARSRFEHEVEVGSVHRSQLEWLLSKDLPCINTGVFGVSKAWMSCAEWQRLTRYFRRSMMHDEIAMQFLMPHCKWRLMPDDYNCLVKNNAGRNPAGVVIWHCTAGYYGLGIAADLWAETLTAMVDADWAGLGGLDVSLLRPRQ